MTSDTVFDLQAVDHLFVWIYLPNETEPVVAGRLDRVEMSLGPVYEFTYGRSYLGRGNAIPISLRETLAAGAIDPTPLKMTGTLRDSAPDAWGRRVIINRFFSGSRRSDDTEILDEIAYMLASGSDRIGALDFQISPTDYIARTPDNASLDELLNAADRVQQGLPLSDNLARAIQHGTAVGGARPKATITSEGGKWIAKFSTSDDPYSLVRAEAAAMWLAREAGLNVPEVRLEQVMGRDVLLVRRFDRTRTDTGWTRRIMASALTLLTLDEMEARYAGCPSSG
jgi:serine/threonine-protein kinase HipA